MVANPQRPESADYAKDNTVEVHSYFSTIQGEGPFSGQCAFFIRLAGCNLRCPGCDTDYTSKRNRTKPWALVEKARAHSRAYKGNLVVITGGEPLRQNIAGLVRDLLACGFVVQIETNGVLACDQLPVSGNLRIICSPKTSRIHRSVYERACAFKYVLQEGYVDAEDGLPTRALGHPASPRIARPRPCAPVYVQPMDELDPERNRKNTEAVVRSAMFHGYRLQLQVHKFINME